MHKNSKKVAGLLTIGTEVTDGQILNTNSQVLSQNLNDLAFNVLTHISVQDDETRIIEALEFLSHSCNEIFITGGLGPTADDITRTLAVQLNTSTLKLNLTMIAGKKLRPHLRKRNIEVAKTNQRQCIFPQDSIIIDNPVGTANAFAIEKNNCRYYVLPGPPREIKPSGIATLNHILKKKLLITWSS